MPWWFIFIFLITSPWSFVFPLYTTMVLLYFPYYISVIICISTIHNDGSFVFSILHLCDHLYFPRPPPCLIYTFRYVKGNNFFPVSPIRSILSISVMGYHLYKLSPFHSFVTITCSKFVQCLFFLIYSWIYLVQRWCCLQWSAKYFC